MPSVWIWGENCEQALELLNIGKTLSQTLDTDLTAFALDIMMAQSYLDHGCDEVLMLPILSENQPFESYASVISEQAQQDKPEVILFSATKRGNEIAARVAVHLNTDVCTNCVDLSIDQQKQILMRRQIYGGIGLQTLVCSAKPVMATVGIGIFEPANSVDKKGKNIIRKINSIPYSSINVIERVVKRTENVSLRKAKVIVCVGRGIQKQEDIKLAQELARILGGTLACSKPVAIDRKWLPEDKYVGISGIKVKPDLYIGIGVSGQPQHVSGICDSKTIVVINHDPDEPFFEAADYGIVGNLYEIVPILINEIKSRNSTLMMSATG